MARPKKAKHRIEPDSAAATLDELETQGDRLVEWVSSNPSLVLGVLLAVLVIGGGVGMIRSSLENTKVEASGELAKLQREYRKAMGASADDLIVPAPANPATALRVRSEYVERFEQAANANAGTAAGGLSALEAGLLRLELDQPEEALATWGTAASELAPGDVVVALLELRIAGVLESQGAWSEAGAAFEKAGAVEAFPLRHAALADAARCFAEAGETDRALAIFSRITSENPDLYLPEHVSTMLRELEARSRLN